MTAFFTICAAALVLLLGTAYGQDDFIRMMMLTQLLGGGGFGGGGMQQTAPQHTQISTGFEGDPRSIGGAGGSSGPGGGLFGGLMGLLSRSAGGGAAPLLLDVDGDILRQHLWNRLGGPGGSASASGTGSGGSLPVSAVNQREASASGPLNVAGSGASGPTGGGRPKSMPLFDMEMTGSVSNPTHLEGGTPGESHGNHASGPQPTGLNAPP